MGSKLAELFSAAVFQRLSVPEAGPAHVRALLDQTGTPGLARRMRLRLLFDRAYAHLMSTYRCEYIFKNALTNSLLLANHTLGDGPHAARLLTEFWVGEAKADLAIINGTSTVYEIKTELDDFNRLPHQLRWYSMLFDRVNVVASPVMKDALLRRLPEHVGLLLLSDAGDITTARSAMANRDNISVSVVFRAMRKLEVLEFCRQRFGVAEDVPNSIRAQTCWKYFSTLSPAEAHDAMVGMIRRRAIHPVQLKLIESAPASLKHLALAKNLNLSQYRTISEQLDVVA